MGSVNVHVDLRREGEVAVITIDNPPVNALKHEVRDGLVAALRRAGEDAGVRAVVLAGAGRLFSGGADITEFGTPLQSRPPTLFDVLETLDAMPKAVIAALHGTTLGGGLEIALTCHFRVAAAGTRLGLPEIKLGLIPGAGGTQRLPRLIGPQKALKAIVSGDPIPAAEALADGLLDEIVQGDLVAGAVAFARRTLAEGRAPRRTRDRDEKLEGTRAGPAAYEEAANALTQRLRGQKAPQAAVESVRNSFLLPFDEALKRERATFFDLLRGDESKARRYVFFAEREANKLPGPAVSAEITRAAVIGAGTMGGGIAMCFANVGIPVTVVETGADALAKGLERIAGNYKVTVAKGSLSAEQMARRMALITGTTDLAAVNEADVVIEAVFEDMGLKKRIFAELDRLAKPSALLASNTSTLDIDVMARATQRPVSVVGMHFFSPANVMRLLEVVRGGASSPEAVATAVALGRKLAKVPVVVGVCDGFVGNRMLARRSAECERLLLQGALPAEIDAAVVAFGFPMGPLAMADLVGLDVGWRIRQARGTKAPVADALCEAGRLGQKNGRGFYRYEASARTPIPDPEVEQLIAGLSRRLGIARNLITAEEIAERMIYPVINEGARILEEGIATRASDIDVIWIYGYGWPAWRGGPMFYADQVGLSRIVERLETYAKRSGDAKLEPAPLLRRLAAEGRGFLAERQAA